VEHWRRSPRRCRASRSARWCRTVWTIRVVRLILISRIAQHTHNLRQDPKCSLMVGERGAEDVQAVGRLTVLAEAEQLTDAAAIAAAAERYYRYFPESRSYHTAHDFDFWVLKPVRHRYIGGFGAIHWLDQVTLANPFAGQVELRMVEHMNDDHANAIRALRRS
jgi:heme iron utilization protein